MNTSLLSRVSAGAAKNTALETQKHVIGVRNTDGVDTDSYLGSIEKAFDALSETIEGDEDAISKIEKLDQVTETATEGQKPPIKKAGQPKAVEEVQTESDPLPGK